MTIQEQLEELIYKCPKEKLNAMYLDYLLLMCDVNMTPEQILSTLKEKYKL